MMNHSMTPRSGKRRQVFRAAVCGVVVSSTLLVGTGIGTAQAADRTAAASAAFTAGDAAAVRSLLSNPALLKAAGVSPNVADREAGWKEKVFVFALRHGGALLESFLKRLSPKAAKWVGGNLAKLANFLDSLENIAAYPIITFLVSQGVPVEVATNIADVILFFIG